MTNLFGVKNDYTRGIHNFETNEEWYAYFNMKINISEVNQELFMVHEHIVNGEVMHLIQPCAISCKWNQSNKHFRSSLWNINGELVSAGLPKFVNWGENPDNFPVPTSLKNCTVVEKMDGSLLIISKYKGNYILRTRGTVDASKMENGHELEFFKSNILPKLNFEANDTWNYSVLFEWYSPLNRVVIRYGDDAQYYLVGMIEHSDYSLADQETLDKLADAYGLLRPNTYTFTTLSDLLTNVDAWKGKEGVVIYSKNGQELHKVKASDYLIRHRLKDEFGSLEKVLDFFISQDCPDYHTFYNKVAEVVDFETAEECRGDISKCVDAHKDVNKIIFGMRGFVEGLKHLPTRKEQALKVLSSYGNTNRGSFVFKLLDGKTLDSEDHKKLFWQVLKK